MQAEKSLKSFSYRNEFYEFKGQDEGKFVVY